MIRHSDAHMARTTPEGARARLRGRDAIVRARCAPCGGAEIAIKWLHDDALIFAESFGRAFLSRALDRCGVAAGDPARTIVRLVMRAVSGVDGALTVDAASMDDLVAFRDGGARDDDAFDFERCYLILGLETSRGERAHVPLPLTRVRLRGSAVEGEGEGSATPRETEDAARARIEALEEEARRMRRRHEAEIAALKSKHEAAMAAMRANETRLRVKLRDATATAKAVERTRAAREGRARGRGDEREREDESDENTFRAIVAISENADRAVAKRQDEAMDEIDARLRSLQAFLSRSKDESRPPPSKSSPSKSRK